MKWLYICLILCFSVTVLSAQSSQSVKIGENLSISLAKNMYMVEFENPDDVKSFEQSEKAKMEKKGVKFIQRYSLVWTFFVGKHFDINQYRFKTNINYCTPLYNLYYKNLKLPCYKAYQFSLIFDIRALQGRKQLIEKIKADPFFKKFKPYIKESDWGPYYIYFNHDKQMAVSAKQVVTLLKLAKEISLKMNGWEYVDIRSIEIHH